MIRRMILLALGLSLLVGCSRRDDPTVRQTSASPGDENAATTASVASQDADAVCPGSGAGRKTRANSDAGKRSMPNDALHSKLADGTNSRMADAGHSKRADRSHPKISAKTLDKIGNANLPKSGDANPPKIGDAKPEKVAGVARSKAARRDTAVADSRQVRFEGLCLVAPKTWTREQPPIDLIHAQFSLARAAGDSSDAQLTVAPGGLNDPKNLERLREEIKNEKEGGGSVEHLQIGGNEVVLVDSSGVESPDDDGDASATAGAPAKEVRYRVLNAMVFVAGKVYFVNCTGPEKTVSERAAEFREFLQTMKPVD